jgi:PAS domain-containing protein
MSKRAVNLLRKMAVPVFHDSTNPLVGVYRKWLAKTADYTVLASESGAVIHVNPAATTLIQLPAAATVGAGWHCSVIIDEQDGGTMDQIVNIGTASGEFFTGMIIGGDGGGAVVANGSSHDFINCSTDSTSGEKFDFVSDGTYMHCVGIAIDVSDTLFATSAAS